MPEANAAQRRDIAQIKSVLAAPVNDAARGCGRCAWRDAAGTSNTHETQVFAPEFFLAIIQGCYR